MKRPTFKNQQEIAESRGSGKIGSTLDYLKRNDPTQYYYEKLKSENNQYLRADMWAEAAKRGETEYLIDSLEKSKDIAFNPKYEEFLKYGDFGNYDSYMLALREPTLDNTDKSRQMRTTTDEAGNVIELGEMTDKEYADQVLESYFEYYKNQQIEQEKANKSFMERLGAGIISTAGNVTAAAAEGIYDVYNIGEGLFNMIFNLSGDNDVGSRFLWAFANDDEQAVGHGINGLKEASYNIQRQYTHMVNAVTGDTSWLGKTVNGVSQAIGYLLPTMIIPGSTVVSGSIKLGTGTLKTAAKSTFKKGLTALGKNKLNITKQTLFYTQILGGNIKDNVETLCKDGISYRDLNAGQVVGNAVLKSAAEWAIEYALGKIIGFSKLDRRIGMNGRSIARSTKEVAKDVIKPATSLKAFGQSMARVGKDTVKEGLEEVLQDLSNDLIDMSFGGAFRERGIEALSIENLTDAFIVGAFTSIIIGGVANLQYINPDNRGVGIKDDGKLYRMGLFETLSYNEAMRTMSQWVNDVRNEDLKPEKRVDAALKLNVAFNTLGNILKEMGLDRSLQVFNILAQRAKVNEDKAEIAKLTTVQYANKLFENFTKGQSELVAKYKLQKEIEKVQKAITKNKKLEQELKDANVTEVDNIVTEKIDTSNTADNVHTDLQKALRALGVNLIVGVNGNIVTKSEDIVFVDNKIIQTSDLGTLLKGLSYNIVVEEVGDSFSQEFKDLLAKTYQEITGQEADLEQQVTALLFDKQFYLKMLLVTQEQEYKKAYKNKTPFEVLTSLYNIVNKQIAKDASFGNLTIQAYKALTSRIQSSMQQALVTYATLYNNLDLGSIPNSIITPQMKAEINNHPNRVFTAKVDEVFDPAKTEYSNEDLQFVIDTLNKFSMHQSEREQYINLFKSGKEGREQVRIIITLGSKFENINPTKVVYLPADDTDVVSFNYTTEVEQLLGATIKEVIEDFYDPADFADEIKEYVAANKVDLSSQLQRWQMINDILYMKSNKTLTIGSDGTVVKIIKADDFLKPGYRNIKKLKNAMRQDKVLRVKDLTDLELPMFIGDTPIEFGNENAYSSVRGVITLSTTFDKSNLMHEITHCVQEYTNQSEYKIRGTYPTSLEKYYTTETINSIVKDIKTKMPYVYEFFKNKSNNFKIWGPSYLIYYLTSGELQANEILNNHLSQLGIAFKADGTIISPTGIEYSIKQTIRAQAEKKAKEKAETKAKETTNIVPTKEKVEKKVETKAKETKAKERTETTNVIPIKEKVEKKVETKAKEKTETKAKETTNVIPVKETKKTKAKKTNQAEQLSMFDEDQADIILSNTTLKDFNKKSTSEKLELINRGKSPFKVTKYQVEATSNFVEKASLRILTPRESFRHMGVKDSDFDKLKNYKYYNFSDRQLYHLAGDSIVVNVLQGIFDKLYEEGFLNENKPVRLVEMFAGYGSQELALQYSNHNYISHRIVEWALPSILAYDALHSKSKQDYASNMSKEQIIKYLLERGISINYNEPASYKSLSFLSEDILKAVYNAIHRTNNLVDINKTTAKDLNLTDNNCIFTYSFPCQDLSKFGKRAGMEADKATRSSMVWQVLRILTELHNTNKLPKILLMENVPEIVNSTNIKEFKKLQNALGKLGYKNYVKTLSALQFNIPQTRERTFMVSILDDEPFYFPYGESLKISSKDLKEIGPVDKKYYINSASKFKQLLYNTPNFSNTKYSYLNRRYARTLTTGNTFKLGTSPQIYADNIIGEAEVNNIIFPKSERDVQNINKITKELDKHKVRLLTNKQLSMFDEDQADVDVTKKKKSKENRTYVNVENATGNKKYYVVRYKDKKGNIKFRGFLMENKMQDFLDNVELDKLDNWLQVKIRGGRLSINGIKDYVETTTNMNDYTFKMIAEYIYDNYEAADTSYTDFKKLLKTNNETYTNEGKESTKTFSMLENIATLMLIYKHGVLGNKSDYNSRLSSKIDSKVYEDLGITEDLVYDNMTIDEMIDAYNVIYDKIMNSKNNTLIDEFNKWHNYIQMTWGQDTKIDLDNVLKDFMLVYDGTIESLFHIVRRLNKDKYTVQKYYEQGGSEDNEGRDDNISEESVDTAGQKTGIGYIDAAKTNTINYEVLLGNEARPKDADSMIRELTDIMFEQITSNKMINKKYKEYNESKAENEKIEYDDFLKIYQNSVNRYIDKYVSRLEELRDLDINELENLYTKTINNNRKITDSNITEDMIKRLRAEKGKADVRRVKGSNITSLRRRLVTLIRQEKRYIDYINKDTRKQLEDIGAIDTVKTTSKEKFKGKQLQKLNYANMTKDELTILENAIKIALTDINQGRRKEKEILRKAKKKEEVFNKQTERLNEQIKREREKSEKYKEQYEREKSKKKIGYRTKINVEDRTINIESNKEPNKLVKKLLSTEFKNTRMSRVKLVESNKERFIGNMEEYFAQNLNDILATNDNIPELEEALEWFLSARFKDGLAYEEADFEYIRLLFFKLVKQEYYDNNLFVTINKDLVKRIDEYYTAKVSMGAKITGLQASVVREFDPIASLKQADMTVDGVTLDKATRIELYDAIKSGNVEKMRSIQQKIIDLVEKERTDKRSVLRKIVSIRSMSMLSSPITWLRNIVSNHAVSGLNKLASAIGKRTFKGKTQADQFKLDMEVSDDIKEYINQNFINNQLFKTIVSNITKYDPADVDAKFKDKKGNIKKDAIMAQLVIKSLYGDYYNNHLFSDNKAGRAFTKIHKFIMDRLSDNKWVEKATTKYFGKIIAERGYDVLDKDGNISTEISDEIMNDFATALGLGLKDYMHDNNVFNAVENWLADRSEISWFAYKMFLPFASASWEWFKGAWKLTPFSLVRSIWRLAKLEKTVAKAQKAFEEGKTNISPELTEYLARRDLGLGVIGTIAFALGCLLAALGFIQLEDDDYGVPKLKFGSLRIDVSSIFGTSSLLAGAAFVKTVIDNEGWDGFIKSLNNMGDVFLEGMPMLQIIEMDMYAHGAFSIGWNNLESIALSFIPNIVAYAAGATYTGKLDKQGNLFYKAIAKIPFLNNLVPKKVNPYTGDKGDWIVDALINRMVPYFSLDIASQNESKSTELGLNKAMLRGSYTINEKEIKVSGHDLEHINELYGKWNAKELDQFYNNRLSVNVKTGNTYKILTYNQMTNEQRKNAVQNIMQNNAEIAKIKVWLDQGHKYYASQEVYNRLKKYGITKNVYLGLRGFVD